MYKDDYAAGGYRVLPVIDPTGRKTARSILLWSLALIPVSLWPVVLMRPTPAGVYAVLAGAMAVGFMLLAVKLAGTLARVLRRSDAVRDHPVHGRREAQHRDEAPVPSPVEDVARGEQERVLPDARQPRVERQRGDQEQREVDRNEAHVMTWRVIWVVDRAICRTGIPRACPR